MVKKAIKCALQSAIHFAGPQNLHNPFRSYLVILTYHRVLPNTHSAWEIEQPGMYVSPKTFEMHMKNLRSRFTLMHLSQWIVAARQGRIPRRALAITFDDGWLDNYEFAYPILQHYQIPATVFVVTDLVGTNYSFWPNRLGQLLSGLGQDQLVMFKRTELYVSLKEVNSQVDEFLRYPIFKEKIDGLISLSKRIPEAKILSLLKDAEVALKINEASVEPDLMSWSQIKEMTKDGLVEIGSHTRHHCRLIDEVGLDVLEDEIAISKNIIIDKLDRPVNLFCYPNGDYNESALNLVRQHYSAACTTMRGWNTNASDKFMLKRLGLHEDISASKEAFWARLSGYL